MSTLTPNVIWAQRKDKLYLTVELADTKNAKISLDPSGKVHFEGESSDKHYKVDLELLKAIDASPEKSKWTVQARNVQFLIEKKEIGPYWERLLKQPGKQWFLKVDWNRWKDEDEADEGFDTSNFDMGAMGDMGDMDYGEDEGEQERGHDHEHDHDHEDGHEHHHHGGGGDSDDEGLPDLEPQSGEKKEEENQQVID